MSARTARSRKGLALLCVGVLWTAGCVTRRPPKMTFSRYGGLQTPVVPTAVAAPLDAPPEMSFELAPTPAELASMRSAPAKPRVAPAPVAEPAKPEKQPQPVIVPEVNTQEMEAAKAEAQHNLDMVDKNLSLSSGKSLDAAQQDVVSKVHGFADGAREAMRTGDWVRARNLSKKAEVLSEELAGTL
jgi:hypothetical protein